MNTTKSSTLEVFDWLRFPLAVGVVFVHSFGARVVDQVRLVNDPLSWGAIYDFLRVFGSKALPLIAVPIFYIMSGYLFFSRMPDWDWNLYGQKLRRRVRTLLLPYLGWNIFHIVHLSWPTLMKVFSGQRSVDALWALLHKLGGFRMFFDSHLNRPVPTNIFGIPMESTGPVLMPLWFMRDLMIVLLFAPVLYWLLRRFGRWVVAVLAACFVLNLWVPVHGTSIYCTFWFTLGSYFAVSGRDPVQSLSRYRRAAYPIAAVSVFLLAWLRAWHGAPDSFPIRLVYIVYVFSAVISAFGIASYVCRNTSFRFPSWLVHATFFIYCTHIFMRKQVLTLILSLFPSPGYPILIVIYYLVPILTVAACVVTRQLFVKMLHLQRG